MGDYSPEKPDYGIDGSPFRVPLIAAGVWAGAVSSLDSPHPALKILGLLLLAFALFFTFIAFKFLYYVNRGKMRLRDRLLSMVDWKGQERVLDVGTGRGLLMIGAAKRLAGGKSVGIDIWRREDMHRNNPMDTLKNARLEGVQDKVEVKNEDAQKMPFADGSFNVVLSNLCIHNIPTAEGRAQACREIFRVLKPGGKLLLADAFHLKDYARVFRDQGLRVQILPGGFWETCTPWHRILEASK